MAGKKGTKLGPRTTVLFQSGQGQGKGSKSVYIYPLKSVASKLGMETAKSPLVEVKRAGKTTKVRVRGSFRAKHIKVPVSSQGANSAAGKKGATQKYLSVPVPAGATIEDIVKFLSKLKNKPKTFVSPDGRTISID